MIVRCKMKLENVFPYVYGSGVKAIYRCVYDENLCKEDKSFRKSTP